VKPLIGITGRRLEASVLTDMDARFVTTEFDFFFSDYARCVARAGGVPVLLPFEAGNADCIQRLDGLVITGGQDVHHSKWGGPDPSGDEGTSPRLDRTVPDVERDDYEIALIAAAVDRDLPLLGICRGHQLLNVALGGTLIPDLAVGRIGHFAAAPAPCDDVHEVRFAEGTTAASIYGEAARVNSWHHQAVDRCASPLREVGWAEDGVVEAIEMPGHPVLGVQWHPEWHSRQDPVFEWLTHAAAEGS
jgi:putative glutamine amidotransferase